MAGGALTNFNHLTIGRQKHQKATRYIGECLEASPPHPCKYIPPFETLEPTSTTLVPSII